MGEMIRCIEIKTLEEACREIQKIGADEKGVGILSSKAVFKIIKVDRIRTKAANLLKQTFLGKGGDVAVSRHSADLSEPYTDALIFATLKQYRAALAQLEVQPWGLRALAGQIRKALITECELPKRQYVWKDASLNLDGKTSLVMGILNLTPDSFSDGGEFNDRKNALKHVLEMQEAGADLIDIGAESTRPYGGAEKVTEKEELARLLPILEYVKPYCKVPISVDTYKAPVAEAALKNGAHIINDIWGLQHDARMAQVAAAYGAPVVIMHNHHESVYPEGVIQHMLTFFKKSMALGIENGMKQENIIIDPGIGFAKNNQQNMYILNHLDQLKVLDCPILLGISRKKFIGEALGLPVQERVEGTIAVSAIGKQKGVQIHRVHDVKEVKRALKMLDVMTRSGENESDFNQ